MKLGYALLFLLSISTVFSFRLDGLAEGKMCYQSTPDFGGQEKACAKGLKCDFKTPPAKGKTGVPKYCIANVAKVSATATTSTPTTPSTPVKPSTPNSPVPAATAKSVTAAEGEVCYKSTPNFGNPKACPTGFKCAYKAPTKGKTGVSKFCIKA